MCIRDSDITADELLSGAGGNTATKTEQAERLIRDLLADGKQKSRLTNATSYKDLVNFAVINAENTVFVF